MLHDNFTKDFQFKLNVLLSEDLMHTLEECSGKVCFLLTLDRKLDHRAPRVQWLNDLILVVTGEDESTGALKLLNERPEQHLHVRGGVVCLIDDKHLVTCLRGQRDGRNEGLGTVPHSVQEATFVRSIDHIVISTQFIAQCLGNGSLTNASRTC